MRVHEMFDDIENFYESMTFRSPPSLWKQVEHRLERELIIDDEKIIVIIDPQVYPVGGKMVDFLNIGFEGFDENGVRTDKLTNKSENGSKIIGAVSNALITKLPEFEYSALSFIARDKIERRMTLYSRIVRNNLQKLGEAYQSNIKLNDGSKAIVVFSKMNTPWSKEFIEWLKKQNKL